MQTYTRTRKQPGLPSEQAAARESSSVNPPNSALASHLGALSSRRVELSAAMNKKLEERFGVPLPGLKTFSDEGLSGMGHAGYSRGNEVHIDSALSVESGFGAEVLSHEVGHVVQTGAGLAVGSGYISSPGLERQAGDSGFSAPQSFSMPVSAAGPIQGWGFASLKGRKDRGHDLLMPEGVRLANAASAPPHTSINPFHGNTFTANDMENLNIGNYINDMGPSPRGSVVERREDGSRRSGLRNQIKFGGDFLFGGRGGSLGRFNPFGHRTDFVQNTHTGTLQFLHGMKSTNDRDALDTTRKMKLYADLGYGIGASGKVGSGNVGEDGQEKMLTLDSRMSDLGNSRFAELGFQNISDLYTGDMRKALMKESDYQTKIDKIQGQLNGDGLSERKRQSLNADLTKYQEKRRHTQGELSYMRARANGENPGENTIAPKKMQKLEAEIRKNQNNPKKLAKLTAERDALITGYQGKTIREMTGVTDSDKYGSIVADRAAQMRLLGSVAHMAQDSFCNSHAFRGEVSRENRGNPDSIHAGSFDAMMNITPGILQTADYTVQDEHKHHHADILAHADGSGADAGKTDSQLNDPRRINATAGAAQARLMTSHILYGARRDGDNNPFISNSVMHDHFERMFALDPAVERGLKLKRNAESIQNGQIPTEQIDGEVTDDDLIHQMFSLPGSGRGYTQGELGAHYTGDDESVKSQMADYSSLLHEHELGEGTELSPNRIKQKDERMRELMSQYGKLQTASTSLGSTTDFAFSDELHNHMFEIYKQMQTVSAGDEKYNDVLREAFARLLAAANKKNHRAA